MLQTSPKISSAEVDSLYTQLMNKANAQMGALQSKLEQQKSAEEQERLRRIQQEMEEQKRRKEAEEAAKKAVEEDRKKYEIAGKFAHLLLKCLF